MTAALASRLTAVAAILAAAAVLRSPGQRRGPPPVGARRGGPRRAVRGADRRPARGRSAGGRGDVAAAEAAIAGNLERELRAHSPAALRELRAALVDAEPRPRPPATRWRSPPPAGSATAALRRGAFDVAVATTRRRRGRARPRLAADPRLPPGDPLHPPRRRRDRPPSTRSRRARSTPAEAVTGIRKDLLDAYQARLDGYLDDAEQADERGFDPAFAENAALAAGYWLILGARVRAPARRRGPRRDRRRLRRARGGRRGRRAPPSSSSARERVTQDLNGFTAAPFTAGGAGAARRTS